MKKPSPSWELYERLIARMISDQLSTDYCVTPNARISGRISGRKRQVDVLIDARHNTDNTRRIIVDAKKRLRRIDVTHVEAFRGLMEDVGATHGYLVSPAGYTKAAERRAQDEVSIRILPLDRLDEFDPSTWPKCANATCHSGRVFWDGYPEIELTLQSFSGNEHRRIPFVHYVGKCDRCGLFHVKCLSCGDLISLPEDKDDDYGHRCRCNLPWFWLASIEEDENGCRSAELHAVLGIGSIMTVDRRGL
ncbi:MAG: restriction endonuclease [Gammaproteobacteria bacterium HGW-Gammaproteobacteria-1]|nr:MAG: restriction endonuclease [Gammaproteobacteria bacterium HGW-Gammaproteobacteria-1]